MNLPTLTSATATERACHDYGMWSALATDALIDAKCRPEFSALYIRCARWRAGYAREALARYRIAGHGQEERSMTPRMKAFLTEAAQAAHGRGILLVRHDRTIAGRAVTAGYGLTMSTVVFTINEKGRAALDEETS